MRSEGGGVGHGGEGREGRVGTGLDWLNRPQRAPREGRGSRQQRPGWTRAQMERMRVGGVEMTPHLDVF